MGCTLPTKPRVALPSESAIGIKEDEIHDNYSDLDSEGAVTRNLDLCEKS